MFLRLAGLAAFILAITSSLSGRPSPQAELGAFVVKPYIQLGDRPALMVRRRLK
jgi:hypothetical protein